VSYSEPNTGINYISDVKFINTGVSKRVKVELMPDYFVLQELEFVRSFPKGVRNCYKIDVTSGIKYLMRATFFYGNYDDRNQPPQFDLYVGANLWGTVMLSNESHPLITEIIYTPSQDYIQPCLVNTGNGIPVISTIELRPLNNKAYETYSARSGLSVACRFDLGSNRDLQSQLIRCGFDFSLMKSISSNSLIS
jgi:hypothetical protein